MAMSSRRMVRNAHKAEAREMLRGIRRNEGNLTTTLSIEEMAAFERARPNGMSKSAFARQLIMQALPEAEIPAWVGPRLDALLDLEAAEPNNPEHGRKIRQICDRYGI